MIRSVTTFQGEEVVCPTLAECIKRGEELQAENAALIGIVEKATAAVQRIQELRDRFRDHEKWVSYRNVETLLTRALDGDA